MSSSTNKRSKKPTKKAPKKLAKKPAKKLAKKPASKKPRKRQTQSIRADQRRKKLAAQETKKAIAKLARLQKQHQKIYSQIVQVQRTLVREKERLRRAREKRRKLQKRPAKPVPKPKPKPPLPQIFGKGRKDLLIDLTPDIKTRIEHAEVAVKRELVDGNSPTDRNEDGLEYYQLIAQQEGMTTHDIFTLFMS